MTRRRAFAASVALTIAAHAGLAVVATAAPGVEPRRPHAHTVWLSGAPAPTAPGRPGPGPIAQAAPRPVAVGTAEIAAALPARELAETVARTREALAEPVMAEARDAIAPDRLAAYRRPSELTRRAQVASAVDLSFRPASPTAARGGSARFIVLVSALGTVDDVVVEQSTLPEEFRALAVAGFQQARFTPGMVDSVPVPARVIIEVSDTAGRGT